METTKLIRFIDDKANLDYSTTLKPFALCLSKPEASHHWLNPEEK